jgi:hypothetical protein
VKVTNDSATTLGTKETTDDDTIIDETMNETSGGHVQIEPASRFYYA